MLGLSILVIHELLLYHCIENLSKGEWKALCLHSLKNRHDDEAQPQRRTNDRKRKRNYHTHITSKDENK